MLRLAQIESANTGHQHVSDDQIEHSPQDIDHRRGQALAGRRCERALEGAAGNAAYKIGDRVCEEGPAEEPSDIVIPACRCLIVHVRVAVTLRATISFFLLIFATIRVFSIFFRRWANLVAGLRAVCRPLPAIEFFLRRQGRLPNFCKMNRSTIAPTVAEIRFPSRPTVRNPRRRNKKPAQKGPDDANNKVADEAEAAPLHELSCQPSCGQANQQEIDQIKHSVFPGKY